MIIIIFTFLLKMKFRKPPLMIYSLLLLAQIYEMYRDSEYYLSYQENIYKIWILSWIVFLQFLVFLLILKIYKNYLDNVYYIIVSFWIMIFISIFYIITVRYGLVWWVYLCFIPLMCVQIIVSWITLEISKGNSIIITLRSDLEEKNK